MPHSSMGTGMAPSVTTASTIVSAPCSLAIRHTSGRSTSFTPHDVSPCAMVTTS